ncbi:MAG: protein kinase [Anaerolineales bacterium]|nr:protein kinase [Anaerolineales bacterium]
MAVPLGQALNNRYRIDKLLGQGGFGAVYLAWDNNFQLPCAIKENRETSPEAQRQFLREAQILHNLRHPNLPLVKDYFILPGQGQYLVMDYIEGEDLQSLLEKSGGPLPEAQVLPWIEQVCQALSYIHSQTPPVIHRDIKPANIKITPQGKAVLVDFGIAKLYDPQALTTGGARAVTPGYSPPEQYSQGLTDPRSDLYSLAATLYTLLTGVRPPESVLLVGKNGPQRQPARSLNPAVSPAVAEAIERGLQADRNLRFASVEQFQAALNSPPPAAPALQSKPQPKRALPRLTSAQKRWLILGAAAWLMVMLGLGFVAGYQILAGVDGSLAAAATLTPLPSLTPTLGRTEPVDAPAPTVLPTLAPSPTALPSKTPLLPSSTSTATLEVTPSPTVNSLPIAIVGANSANIRTGPDNDYPVMKIVLKGVELQVMGRSRAGSWLLVLLEDGSQGWIILTAVIFDHDVTSLPEATAAPPPTRTPSSDDGRFQRPGGKG